MEQPVEQTMSERQPEFIEQWAVGDLRNACRKVLQTEYEEFEEVEMSRLKEFVQVCKQLQELKNDGDRYLLDSGDHKL
jgi:hypothetical protein